MPRLSLPQSPSQSNSMQLILPTEPYEPEAAEAPPQAYTYLTPKDGYVTV